MARSGRDARKADRSSGLRWIIGGSALLLAGLAFYVLMTGGGSDREPAMSEERAGDREADRSREALDEIDAKSREAMRDLLREAGE